MLTDIKRREVRIYFDWESFLVTICLITVMLWFGSFRFEAHSNERIVEMFQLVTEDRRTWVRGTRIQDWGAHTTGGVTFVVHHGDSRNCAYCQRSAGNGPQLRHTGGRPGAAS